MICFSKKPYFYSCILPLGDVIDIVYVSSSAATSCTMVISWMSSAKDATVRSSSVNNAEFIESTSNMAVG